MEDPGIVSVNAPEFEFTREAFQRTVLCYGNQITSEGHETTLMIVRMGNGAIQALFEDNYDPDLPISVELANG